MSVDKKYQIIVTTIQDNVTIIVKEGHMNTYAHEKDFSIKAQDSDFIFFFDDVSNVYYHFNRSQIKSIVYRNINE